MERFLKRVQIRRQTFVRFIIYGLDWRNGNGNGNGRKARGHIYIFSYLLSRWFGGKGGGSVYTWVYILHLLVEGFLLIF